MNCFALLGLPACFALNHAALESAYLTAQRQYHPDRFVGKPPMERQQALQRSVDINNAYHILKDPLKRAQYLLKLQGITAGAEAGGVKPSPALLMETLEWRERIAGANAGMRDELGNSLSAVYEESLHRIAALYEKADWPSMAQETMRLGYIIKAREEIKKPAKGHGE